jgi:hypothetical protein
MEQQVQEDGRRGKLTRAVGNMDTEVVVVGSPRNYMDMYTSWYTSLRCSNTRSCVITYEEAGTAFTRKIVIPDEFPPH